MQKKILIVENLNYFVVYMSLRQGLIWEYLAILKCSCDVLEVSVTEILPDFVYEESAGLLIHLCGDHNRWAGGGDTYIIAVGSRRLTLSSPHRALLWFFLMLWWSGR